MQTWAQSNTRSMSLLITLYRLSPSPISKKPLTWVKAAMLLAAALLSQTNAPQWVNLPKALAPGVTHATLKSPSNGVDVGYSIYLPTGYEKGKTRYPLVLFLHGAGGSEISDAGPGGFTSTFDQVVKAKAFPPSVIVFANGRMSGYRDHPERKEYVETYIVRELLPHVEKTYRAGGSQETRLVCGFSMGGAGGCRLAIKHPDLFAGVIAWGGSVRDSDAEAIQTLQKQASKFKKGGFRFFLGVGEKDDFAQAKAFRDALAEERIEHKYKILPGIGHNLGAYYEQTAEEAFRFVAPAMRGS